MAVAAFLLLLASPSLSPGSAAPKLAVKTWYKGAPVAGFAKDKTYVVEFWATWCGPCRDSIPHLTELAKKNRDVTFVGVSIWEEDKGGNVKSFVDKMGAKMDYHVGYSGNHDGMAKTWMEAAAQNGIPTAFVVKRGAIQWIGHPMELEAPLAKIKAGKFDVVAFKKEFDQQAAVARAEMATNASVTHIGRLYDKGQHDDARYELDGLVKKSPKSASAAESLRFGWLAKEDPAAWSIAAKALAETKDPRKVESLGVFAMQRATETGGADQAREAIGYALDATGRKEFMALWYASEVYAATKDDALALEVTNAMLASFDTSPAKDSKEFKAKLLKDKATLEKRIAAAKGG